MPILMMSGRAASFFCASRKYISLTSFSIGHASNPPSATQSGSSSGSNPQKYTFVSSAIGVQSSV